MNKLAVIQARMSSSRLPGKVLLDIAGKPMLLHVIERARQAKLVDQVVLATTTGPSDDILEQFCRDQGIPCYRGSPLDVLDRFYQAAQKFHADVIIRLTGDCPLLDPHLIDLTTFAFLDLPVPLKISDISQFMDASSPVAKPFDFCANRLPPPWRRTFPIGLDVEVCSYEALERAWKQADRPYQREHVMPYLYEGVAFTPNEQPVDHGWYIQHGSTPRGFRVALLNHFPDYGSLRWTVDTPADLEFVRQVYTHFAGQPVFSWQEILALLAHKPELASINAEVIHKSAFDVDKRTSQS